MDTIFTLLTIKELRGETSLILRIAMIIGSLIMTRIKSIGRFYRMKLGIKGL